MNGLIKGRRSVRLKFYDYSANAGYFITICTYERSPLFGQIVNGVMRLNAFGKMIEEEWFRSGEIRKECLLDEFIVMPNHLHGIILIVGAQGFAPEKPVVGAQGLAPLHIGVMRPVIKPKSVGAFVAGFKSAATVRINQTRCTPGLPVWQRNYHDHIIRGERDLYALREYIHNNPLQWALDKENPDFQP